jgi:hypothetical protein
MEVPNYSTKQNTARILLPRVFILLLLSGLLYIGIRVNFYVFNKEFPNAVNYAIIGGIVILALADIFMTRSRNKENKIYFFNDRIEVRGKENFSVMLGTVANAEVKKNIADMLFRTGSIVLSSGQTIKNINYPERVRDYIIQLIRRSPQQARGFR